MPDKDTLYARWLSGKVSQQELKELDDSGVLKELESIRDTVDQFSLPPFNLDQAYDKLNKGNKKSDSKPNIVKLIWGIAAAASIFLAISVFTLLRLSSFTEVSAKYAQNQLYELPDGSRVTLNDGSSFKFKEKSWDKARTINLVGEASFDVEEGVPFRVETENGIVEVLGTEFNVRSWHKVLAIECYSGKVQVTKGMETQILTRNQAIHLHPNGDFFRITIDHESPLWQSGKSRFIEANLNEVLTEMERQFNITVNHSTRERSFSGTFDHDDIKSALDQVCLPLGLTYTISSAEDVVTIVE